VVVLTAGAHAWSLDAFPRDEMVAALAADGYDAAVAAHCLAVFGGEPAAGAAAGAAALEPRAVCVARARALLAGGERTRADDFMPAWRAAVPEARSAPHYAASAAPAPSMALPARCARCSCGALRRA
jgi:hypothetical protein